MGNEDQKAVEFPPHSVVFKELLEVITHAIAKLSLVWPDEKVSVVCSKFDDFMPHSTLQVSSIFPRTQHCNAEVME